LSVQKYIEMFTKM